MTVLTWGPLGRKPSLKPHCLELHIYRDRNGSALHSQANQQYQLTLEPHSNLAVDAEGTKPSEPVVGSVGRAARLPFVLELIAHRTRLNVGLRAMPWLPLLAFQCALFLTIAHGQPTTDNPIPRKSVLHKGKGNLVALTCNFLGFRTVVSEHLKRLAMKLWKVIGFVDWFLRCSCQVVQWGWRVELYNHAAEGRPGPADTRRQGGHLRPQHQWHLREDICCMILPFTLMSILQT